MAACAALVEVACFGVVCAVEGHVSKVNILALYACGSNICANIFCVVGVGVKLICLTLHGAEGDVSAVYLRRYIGAFVSNYAEIYCRLLLNAHLAAAGLCAFKDIYGSCYFVRDSFAFVFECKSVETHIKVHIEIEASRFVQLNGLALKIDGEVGVKGACKNNGRLFRFEGRGKGEGHFQLVVKTLTVYLVIVVLNQHRGGFLSICVQR